MPNPWLNCPELPTGAAAALAALHLAEPRPQGLAHLTGRERAAALDFCHHAGLALLVPEVDPEATARDAANNLLRLRLLEETYQRLAGLPVEFAALKGITQCALFGIRPEDRAQSDIDLYCPRETVETARDALIAMGYRPIAGLEALPTDHLPALMRPTAWKWRGDFFDPGMPIAIELHFQFWNPQMQRLPAEGVEAFWTRRVRRPVGGVDLAILSPTDAVAYAALHLLKHVLHGETRPFHVYEIASFLHRHADDEAFWTDWRGLHSASLRRLQSVGFLLAEAWFGCRLATAAREEAARLPASTRAWFEAFATSPATQRFHPNKDELWLHLSLLDSKRDALSVASRRLIPTSLPPPARATSSASRRSVYAAWLAARLRHHILSLGTTLTSGARWWWLTNRFGPQFWIFLAVAVLFNFGLFIFALLYNLFLQDLGFHEDFLGLVNAASRVGSVAGTIPAALAARRYGLRRCLVATIAATATVEVGRAAIGAELPLAGLALLSGCAFSFWAVILSPIVAGTVDEERRPAAFSFFFACMFATGIAGNWLGGQLPIWMHGKRPVLMLSAALSALAIVPALRLAADARLSPSPGARVYPRSRFLWRFLIPFGVWHLATGSFNPFNNVYFARLGFSVPRIGAVFSASQVVQVAAVLLAPLVIRRAGLLAGIVWMMAATAFALAGLAAQAQGAAAIAAYFAYMAFQWMSEPGLNSLLMNRVDERERSGASALTFLVAFGAQALAAFAAGILLVRFDYGPVLAGAAALAGLAALLFGRL